MFRQNLEGITEQDLTSLERDQIPESLTMEFKRDLNLASRPERAEAAKDVSAMANTAGGRILYGIDEQTLPDGSKAAGAIRPLTDGTIDTRLEDALLSSIHPRPRFRIRRVPVRNNAGFVLVVEVYPAYASDLHMVTGFKEYRFDKRSEQRTILMDEPEVREAYMRIAASRQALDTAMEAAVSTELALVRATHESVLVVPWFGHRDLVNPQRFGAGFGQELADGPLSGLSWISVIESLQVVSDGYRAYGPPDGQLDRCHVYTRIRRTGLIHFAEASARMEGSGPMEVRVDSSLETLVAALITARYVLDKCAYWGPVRVIHRLKVGSPFFLKDPAKPDKRESLTDRKPVLPGEYTHTVPEVHFREQGGNLGGILRDILHQISQTDGQAVCPWFSSSGEVLPEMSHVLRQDLYEHLKA